MLFLIKALRYLQNIFTVNVAFYALNIFCLKDYYTTIILKLFRFDIFTSKKKYYFILPKTEWFCNYEFAKLSQRE